MVDCIQQYIFDKDLWYLARYPNQDCNIIDEIKGKLTLCIFDIKVQISLSIDIVRSAPSLFTG